MPNYCANYLSVKGLTPSEQAEIKNYLETEAILQHFVPAPEELPYSVNVVDSLEEKRKEAEKYPWWSQRTPEQREEWLSQYVEQKDVQPLIDKYGHADGYNWCIDNWGTKWDVCDSAEVDIADDTLTCFFTSAWSPPVNGFNAISKLFPNATFELCYYEEGYDFTGAARMVGGHLDEFVGTSPSDLMDDWIQANHPELYGDEDREEEAQELWYDCSCEVIEQHIASLLDGDPLSPEVIQRRKDEQEKIKQLIADLKVTNSEAVSS